MPGRSLIVVALALFTSAGIAAASAQTEKRVTPFPQPTGRITWALIPTETLATGGNVGPNTLNRHDAVTRLGWRIGYDVNRRTSLYWLRSNIDTVQGSVVLGGRAVYPNDNFDITDEIGVQWQAARGLVISGGSNRRARQCCPGAGDPTNPSPFFQNGVFLGVAYSFGTSFIGPLVTVYDQTQWFNHQVSSKVARTLPPGTQIAPSHVPVTAILGATVRIPVFHQDKVVPFLNYAELGLYFNNIPAPAYGNAYEVGVAYTPSRSVSYSATARNFRQFNEGYPFPSPQAQHYSRLYIVANFHGRLPR